MLITAFGMFFVTAVQIALPMVAVLFLADLGLALLTKVAPQLNAINVMFPAKIGLTLLLVGLSFPVLPQAVDRLVELANEAMAALAGRDEQGGSEEKTEKPTPKRRKETRKEGQVPRTQELGAWSAVLLVSVALPTVLGRELDSLRELMDDALSSAEPRHHRRTPSSCSGRGRATCWSHWSSSAAR